MSVQTYGSHKCGGSIINSYWILTTASCIRFTVDTFVKIRVGSSIHSDGGKLYSIEQSIKHPDASIFNDDFDFGLIQLKGKLVFDRNIQPIPLADDNVGIPDNLLSVVTGWGDVSSKSSLYLQAAIVSIINQQLCNNAYSQKITSRMICAGNYTHGGSDCECVDELKSMFMHSINTI